MKIGIIGAGASGMMAAIIASEGGAQVTLIEKKDRVGKKILATGNGKCNFTNKVVNESDYYSQYKSVHSDYISQFNQEQVLSFFESRGMLIKERNDYCYPRSEQAATLLDILRAGLVKNRVNILTECCPEEIRIKEDGFEVRAGSRTLFFHRLILACGGFAGEKKAQGLSGYAYAEKLGHSLVPVVPALVQLKVKDKDFKGIAGVRTEAAVTLYIENKKKVTEQGELQLTAYGISGIPVFQLSRHAAYGFRQKQPVTASIDFLPEYSEEEWKAVVLNKWKNMDKKETLEDFFLGFLNKKLNLLFIREAGLKPQTSIGGCRIEKILQVCLQMKNWEIKLKETNPFEQAQVCAGGVPLSEVTLSLESRKVKGLYFAGELLDVDGRCGGYNLQWAWTSGYIAGKAAAEK